MSSPPPPLPPPSSVRSSLNRALDVAHQATVGVLVIAFVATSAALLNGYWNLRQRRIAYERDHPAEVAAFIEKKQREAMEARESKQQEKQRLTAELRQRLRLTTTTTTTTSTPTTSSSTTAQPSTAER